MAYVTLSNQGATPFGKLMGHHPEILKQWNLLEETLLSSKNFSPEFLEQVRRALAFNNLCQYCMAKAGPADLNPESARLRVALRFANLFAINHTDIDENEINQMKQHFSDSELVEFIAFCSFITASQKFGACLGLQPSEYYSAKT